MRKYAIVIEKATDGGYGAYAHDLPGCVGMGSTKDEVRQNMVEAIQFHLEGLKQEGLPIPESEAEVESFVFVM